MNEVKKLNPITKCCMTIGEIPSSYLITMTYEEQLLWLCDYLKNTVIPTLNNNAIAVEELQNYFENLDVQEEINNKLEKMAEDGTLQEIINLFIQTNCPLIFETVNDMLNSNLLVEGSFCKTLGYYEKEDEGSAFYQIVSGDLEENAFNLKISDNLYAKLLILNNTINLKQLGISTSNTPLQNSNIIYQAFYKFRNGGEIIIPIGNYKITNTLIDFNITGIILKGKSKDVSILESETTGFCFNFTGNANGCWFKDFRLYCNNIASGFNFSKNDGTQGAITFEDVYVANTIQGLTFLHATYLICRRFTVSLSGNATEENNGIYINGYEYNYLFNCGVNYYGSTYKNIDLIKLVNCNWTEIKDCEITHTNGSGIKLENSNHLTIKDNYIYLVGFGVHLASCSDVTFNDNKIFINGIQEEEAIFKFSGNRTSKSCFNNNYCRRNQSVGNTYLISASNDTLEDFTQFLNNYYYMGSRPAFNLNNNKISINSYNSPASTFQQTVNYVPDRTSYSINSPVNSCLSLPNQAVYVDVNFLTDSVRAKNFSVRSLREYTSGRITFTIEFDTPPTEDFIIQYSIRYF